MNRADVSSSVSDASGASGAEELKGSSSAAAAPDDHRGEQSALESQDNSEGSAEQNRQLAGRFLEERAAKEQERVEQPKDLDAARPLDFLEKLKAQAATQTPPELALEPEPAPAELTRPDDMPRAWSNEKIALWNSLPQEVRAHAVDLARSQEEHFHSRQNEIAEQYKQAEAIRGAYEQRAIGEVAIDVANSMEARYAQLFGDLKTEADIQNMAANDPGRFKIWSEWSQFLPRMRQARDGIMARHKDAAAHAQKAMADLVQAQQEHQAKEQAAQWQAWSAQQDLEVEKAIPELADPVKADKLQTEMKHFLLKQGLSQEEIAALSTNPVTRSAFAQKVLFGAMKWEQAQEAAKNALAKAPPRPQSAGVPAPLKGGTSELAAAAARGDMNAFVALRNQGKGVRLMGAPSGTTG